MEFTTRLGLWVVEVGFFERRGLRVIAHTPLTAGLNSLLPGRTHQDLNSCLPHAPVTMTVSHSVTRPPPTHPMVVYVPELCTKMHPLSCSTRDFCRVEGKVTSTLPRLKTPLGPNYLAQSVPLLKEGGTSDSSLKGLHTLVSFLQLWNKNCDGKLLSSKETDIIDQAELQAFSEPLWRLPSHSANESPVGVGGREERGKLGHSLSCSHCYPSPEG